MNRRKLVGKLTFEIVDGRAEIYSTDGKRVAYCHPKTAELIRERGDIRPWLGLVKLY